eukprot:scaffold2646_cov103-Isochrysis_galbana.AAC.3
MGPTTTSPFASATASASKARLARSKTSPVPASAEAMLCSAPRHGMRPSIQVASAPLGPRLRDKDRIRLWCGPGSNPAAVNRGSARPPARLTGECGSSGGSSSARLPRTRARHARLSGSSASSSSHNVATSRPPGLSRAWMPRRQPPISSGGSMCSASDALTKSVCRPTLAGESPARDASCLRSASCAEYPGPRPSCWPRSVEAATMAGSLSVATTWARGKRRASEHAGSP